MLPGCSGCLSVRLDVEIHWPYGRIEATDSYGILSGLDTNMSIFGTRAKVGITEIT